MKRVDGLVLKEVAPMWFFSALLFSVLISAGQFLFELTKLISEGAPGDKVVQLAFLIFPGILVKTFPMGMLLSTLLAFGRLSGDSEIVALRAAGVSVGRIITPVAVMGVVVALVTFVFNEQVVPAASSQALRVRASLEGTLAKKRQQSASQPFFDKGKLIGFINARDVDLASQTLRGVKVVSLDEEMRAANLLEADTLQYTDIHEWKISGHWILYDLKTKGTAEGDDGAWPPNSKKPTITLDDVITRTLNDLDVYDMRQTRENIQRMQADPNHDKGKLANLVFGYWNKLAVPLGALVFGLIGAPLGIRNHRTGAASGFALAIMIIFGYFLIVNTLAVMSQGGLVPPAFASFAPVGVGVLAAVVLINKRNTQ
ncbi:MAG: LptF/LptG family permease [Armatimonadetes bacterium]|nr:LptF/LptG family permease [Armatimonadota bacterium]